MHLLLHAVCLLTAIVQSVEASPEFHEYDDTLFHFKTEPKIKAPKWEVDIRNRSAISPGYIFVGPYETLRLEDEAHEGWIGPAVYTNEGMLVWSGVKQFDNSNTEDFHIATINGEERLILMDQHRA